MSVLNQTRDQKYIWFVCLTLGKPELVSLDENGQINVKELLIQQTSRTTTLENSVLENK